MNDCYSCPINGFTVLFILRRVSSTNKGMSPKVSRPDKQLGTPAPEHREDREERFPGPSSKHARAHSWLTLPMGPGPHPWKVPSRDKAQLAGLATVGYPQADRYPLSSRPRPTPLKVLANQPGSACASAAAESALLSVSRQVGDYFSNNGPEHHTRRIIGWWRPTEARPRFGTPSRPQNSVTARLAPISSRATLASRLGSPWSPLFRIYRRCHKTPSHFHGGECDHHYFTTTSRIHCSVCPGACTSHRSALVMATPAPRPPG
jgi:hypothetical protein